MAELSSRKAITELGPEASSGCFTICMRSCSGTRCPVHPEFALEHPVPGVLRVGLGDLEELDIGGIPAQPPEDARR